MGPELIFTEGLLPVLLSGWMDAFDELVAIQYLVHGFKYQDYFSGF